MIVKGGGYSGSDGANIEALLKGQNIVLFVGTNLRKHARISFNFSY